MESDLEMLLQKLDKFKELGENWDSYGALPIKEDAIQKAKHVLFTIIEQTGFIPQYVVPCPHGGIQFEHHKADVMYDFEIEICPDGKCSVLMPDESEHEDISLEEVCRLIRKYKSMQTIEKTYVVGEPAKIFDSLSALLDKKHYMASTGISNGRIYHIGDSSIELDDARSDPADKLHHLEINIISSDRPILERDFSALIEYVREANPDYDAGLIKEKEI